MRSKVRPYIQVLPTKPKNISRRSALKKLAGILEDQMTDMGLSEEEKNFKTANLVAFVGQVAASKLATHSKRSKPLNNVALQA